MEKIESFKVNHDILTKGMYISRIDGDAVTYDIRMKTPNGGDYLPVAAAHTIEHLFATYARNGEFKNEVIYVGPMGCRTGFYLILRDKVKYFDAIKLVKEVFAFISGYEGEIPGATRKECGNYLEHDLKGAREIASDMTEVLKGWTENDLYYQ